MKKRITMARNRNSSVAVDMPVWVMEVSSDQGETWLLVQSFGMYITQHRAELRAKTETTCHKALRPDAYCYGWLYRAREYRPVEVKA
jgi:hypothetical protein